MDSPKPLRALLLAEAANPEWVSVPLVGWSLAHAIHQQVDSHIVTQIRNRDAILRAGLREGVDFTAIDTEAIARPAHRLTQALRLGKGVSWTIGTAISALSYPWFERKVWKEFGARIEAGEFDVVHRITPVSPTAVSSIAKKCRGAGVPFVVGPLNGGIPWPAGFRETQRHEREWLSSIRDIYKAQPGRKSYLKSTDRFIVGSRHTQSEIPEPHRARATYIPENGIDPSRFNLSVNDDGMGPLRISFIGRMVPYKGPDMLLEAAEPYLQKEEIEIHYIGDGPLLEGLKSRASELGVADKVTFHGWLEHKSVQQIAVSCPILALPSVREFGGGVVLEAMALGAVPIVLDYGGPGELVDDEIGFKVPVTDRSGVIQGLRECLGEVIMKRGELGDMGKRGQARIDKQFTWQAKAAQIVEIYKSLT
ncbi:MAG: glycosyltransferase family 4 protein [Pseudomonadota bacterium]